MRAYLADARQLHLVSAAGDTTVVEGVTEFVGDPVGVPGDAIEARVRSLDRTPVRPQVTARSARGPGDRAEAEPFDTWGSVVVVLRTVLLVGVVALVGGLGQIDY